MSNTNPIPSLYAAVQQIDGSDSEDYYSCPTITSHQTSKKFILTTAMSPSKLEELFPKKEPAPSQLKKQPSTFQKE